MMMKLFQWHYGLLLLPVALWLPSNAQALTCKVDSFVSPNLGIITLGNANNASVEQTLTYSCTNTSDVTQWASICIGVDDGTSQINPRHMIGSDGSNLNFNMTLNSVNNATWGNSIVGGTEFIDFFSVAPGTTTPTIKATVIRVSLLPNNETVKANDYTATFTGSNTALTYVTVDSSNDTKQCSSEPEGASSFSFTVKATVANECKIIAKPTDINLGNIAANATNIKGSTSISLKCTNTAPYTIGLVPSNDSVDGAGVMTGTTPNSDVIPYQLESIDGKAWGNTVIAGSLRNDVAGEGNGTDQLHMVYVTVPSADFKPDNYSDTVTVHVNY